MMKTPFYATALGSFLAVLCGAARAEEKIDFNRDIRPLLSNRCFACHGPDEEERKADLRLDTREGALMDLGGYAALVPGKAEESELFHRITLDADDEELMPPAGKGTRFNEAEVALIKKWIAQEAHYANHWSYDKPVRPAVPKGKRSDWPVNEIDHFVLARLESEGLEPSPEADRYSLARRASLDLTGLPPTWEEVIAFVNDPAPNAYEAYLDRLLAKPAYGERWTRVWLDLARYADSAGYADDPPRTIWAYRDYVLRAFNQNMPFDQFTIEQIAGDLLEKPTRDQLIATAFHRNTMTNSEGGTNDEEFRNEAVVDRVNTTFATWMGTTMACAQCHTHKFDPLTHAEYFQIFAFFNQSEDADLKDERPVLELWSDQQEKDKLDWSEKITSLKKTLATPTDALVAEQGEWVKHLRLEPAWTVIKPTAAKGGATSLAVADDGLITAAAGAKAAKDTYRLEFTVPAEAPDLTALRLEVPAEQASNFVLSRFSTTWQPDDKSPRSGRFVRVSIPGKDKILHLAEVEVFSGGVNVATKGTATQSSLGSSGDAKRAIDGKTDGDYQKNSVSHTGTEANPWFEVDLGSDLPIEKIVVWNRTDGGTSQRLEGYEVSILSAPREVVWKESPAGVPAPSTTLAPGGPAAVAFEVAVATHEQSGFPAKAVLAPKADPKTGWAIAGGTGKRQELTLIRKTPMKIAGGKLIFTLEQTSDFKEHLITHAALSYTSEAGVLEWARMPMEIRQLVRKTPGTLAPDEEKSLTAFYQTVAPSLNDERAELAKLEKQLAEAKPETTVPIMRDRPADQRRKTFVQLRGNYKSLGPEVSEGVPAVFHPLEKGVTPNRLSLAKWLISPDNPLTARVVANRHWEELFGIGIVETSEEFGSQGELPSDQDLLDWLALDFQENGWDIKRLLKQVAMSATYRQSSKTKPEFEERDPYNRLLNRGPRFRLSAEQIRDNALAVSGLLSGKMHGPPVNPPQPEMGLTAAFGSKTDWVNSAGEDRYRRALYTSWRRSNPYPSMATFDAPNGEVCTVRRGRTNTPLQSLVTLNDPVYVEAAQALGRKIVAKGGADLPQRLAFAIRESLAREPRPAEVERLAALYESSLADYTAKPEMAAQLAQEPLGPLPAGSNLPEHAAWTVVSNVILNLDEVFMKR